MKFEKKKEKKVKSMQRFSYIQFSSFFRGLSGNILIIIIYPVLDGGKKKKLFLNLITGSICAGESQPPVFPIQLHADVVSGGLDQRRIEMA